MLPDRRSNSLGDLPLLFHHPTLVDVCLLAIIIIATRCATCDCVRPFMRGVTKFDTGFTATLLLLLNNTNVVNDIVFNGLNGRCTSTLIDATVTLLLIYLTLLLPTTGDRVRLKILDVF